jgi:sulfate adenylyltransferase subunit 2
MDQLRELEARAIYVIREAWFGCMNPVLLWSIGKDSTALLWMVRKAFMGKVPFPVIHIDTGCKFDEIYKFRDMYAKEWDLDLVVARNESALEAGVGPTTADSKLDCCTALKTDAFKQVVEQHNVGAALLGIRRDEHGIRSKERYFCPRDSEHRWDYTNQPPEMWNQFQTGGDQHHVRVHPLLHMTELDIWRYTELENIPVVDLYYASEGKRYRSIGCQPCCKPVDSEAKTVRAIIEELEVTTAAEREGRTQDKEDANAMQKLRALGYM